MPLPDERPRQSVANLIGRFEQQTKRQPSPSAPPIPRSSSVVSQVSGDSAKEETKEKREWPPKSVTSNENSPQVLPSSSQNKSSMPTPPVSPPASIPDDAPAKVDVRHPSPAGLPQSPSSPKTVIAAGKVTPTPAPRNPISPAKNSPGRASIASASRSSVKSLVKPSTASSTATPLKLQNTGNATARAARPTAKAANATPSRPKTPAAPSQEASSRPKTPARVSGGLFAPTAASLARSRNAPPPVPTPAKKTTLSSAVAERLNKPTTASASKARTPAQAPASAPAKVFQSPVGGASRSRGPVKPRVGLAPARLKEAREKKEATAKVAAGVPPTAIPSEVAESNFGQKAVESEHHENGQEETHQDLEDVTHAETFEEHAEHAEELVDGTPDHEEVEHVEDFHLYEGDVLSDSEVHAEETGHYVEPSDSADVSVQELEIEIKGDGAPEDHAGVDDLTPHPSPLTAKAPVVFGSDYRLDEVKTREGENDLEDIVNLLESAPRARPLSIASIPDEDQGEIPDEY